MRITTIGRELIRKALPEDLRSHADKPLDKKNLDALMTELAQRYPEKYVDVLQALNNIGEDSVTYYGREASFSLRDLRRGKEVANVNKKLRAIVDGILDNDSLSTDEKEKRILELGYKYSQQVQDLVFDDAAKRNTALASQIVSGSRGNKTQLMQLQFGNMLMKDALNRDIPYLSIDAYADGVSPTAAWVAASSGRKGFYDTQFATGQAGYMGKQVTNITNSTPIVEDDCGTVDTGLAFKAASTKNVGAVLLRPFHGYPAGTVVTDEMVAGADDDEEMIIRSPVTCKSHSGVCAKCSGLGENGKFPAIGDYVSLNAARSFVEPITQGGIGCLHPGTPVRMADWSVKKLKDLKVGDKIIGVSKKGILSVTTVLHIFNNGILPMYCSTFTRGFMVKRVVAVISTLQHKALFMSGGYGYEEEPIEFSSTRVGILLSDYKGADLPLMGREKRQFYVGEGEVMDIEVDHPDHLFLLANGMAVSNSKHTGGVGGKRHAESDEEDEGDDQPTGFKSVDRLFNVPQNFPGGAVLASAEGRVNRVEKAPQGGYYITVGTTTHYAIPERKVVVKEGDTVALGDMLTNGVPNPAEIEEYKGLGDGRRYFTERLNKALQENGWGTDRRNVEQFTRSMLNKVRITSLDGYGSHLPGDLVDYDEIAAGWKPSEGAATLPAQKAVGKYLEAPVLHYTIGTHITPQVASTLGKYKFDSVLASDNPPPFEPEFVRAQAALANDKSWLTRLSGERLESSLFDAARRGVTDKWDSSSFVTKIVGAPYLTKPETKI